MTPTIEVRPNDHLHFVTGRLAAPLVTHIASSIASQFRVAHSVGVMPITVAALMTTKWLARHLDVPDEATHVILPGWCDQDLSLVESITDARVIVGPNDCRDLPELFGKRRDSVDLSRQDIAIIAEINHAPRRSIEDIVAIGRRYVRDGADVIDFGCDPQRRCAVVADYIKALVDEGVTVSVDTFDIREAADACAAGASLVLSVNSSNRDAAVDWGAEVVVVPDVPGDEKSFFETINFLDSRGVAFRIDPILEPIGAGFGASLIRYADARRRYPDVSIMMGIGNLTELTDVDSAGINLLLLAFCQEHAVDSVLTTEVINWARSSVRECDVARRLVKYAIDNATPPKRITNDLVMLRDAKLKPLAATVLDDLAATIRDPNFRLFAQDEQLHVVSRGLHLTDEDPFRLFEALLEHDGGETIDAGHAFYLGFELAKAQIALTLGKQYDQDRALDWGLLTVEEDVHRIARTSRHRRR